MLQAPTILGLVVICSCSSFVVLNFGDFFSFCIFWYASKANKIINKAKRLSKSFLLLLGEFLCLHAFFPLIKSCFLLKRIFSYFLCDPEELWSLTFVSCSSKHYFLNFFFTYVLCYLMQLWRKVLKIFSCNCRCWSWILLWISWVFWCSSWSMNLSFD